FQAEDGIRDRNVTGVQTCALPIYFADAPQVFRLLAVGLEGPFPRGVLQTHDAVLNARGSEDFDQRDIARPRDVSPSAGLHVPLRDLDHAEFASRDRAALVQSEAELLLRDIAGQVLRADLVVSEDLAIR